MTEQRKPVVDAGFKLLNLTHKGVLRLTGGRWPKDLFGMPGVELQTIGNKSGEPRTVMLTSPIHDDSRVVLIASKGGDHRDPQWYRNLSANPDVQITMQGQTRAMRARTASPEEKAALWPDIVAVYKGYDSYQKKAGRDIPVVICEPRPVLTSGPDQRRRSVAARRWRYDAPDVNGARRLSRWIDRRHRRRRHGRGLGCLVGIRE